MSYVDVIFMVSINYITILRVLKPHYSGKIIPWMLNVNRTGWGFFRKANPGIQAAWMVREEKRAIPYEAA